jgi:uncharacterized protein YukE
MDTITYGDILLHYSQKLKEVFEDVEEIRGLLNDSIGIVETSWKGRAATTCTNKLEDLNTDFLKVTNELSDSITKLTGIIEVFNDTDIHS